VHLIASSFDDIVRFQIPVWDKVLRTVVVYALIYLLIRLAKRDAAQLTASDFVVVLLLSNVVQNAIIGPDNSVLGGAVGAVTLIVVNEMVARWEWARKHSDRSQPGGPISMIRSLWATRTDLQLDEPDGLTSRAPVVDRDHGQRSEPDIDREAIELQQSEARVLDADRRMMVTVDAFAQLARYLSGIPGRKNLVWLSGSFTLGISPDTSGQDPFIQARNYSENVKRVSNLFAEAHVAVYPVDVRGLVTDPLFSASSNDTLAPLSMQESTPTGPAGGGGGDEFPRAKRNASTAVPIAAMQASANQFGLSQMGEHATMDKLAAETGGRAFYNTNGIANTNSNGQPERPHHHGGWGYRVRRKQQF
jgi:hypothetical protein